jgi:HSP20 family protein
MFNKIKTGKKSFFEKLTGMINEDDGFDDVAVPAVYNTNTAYNTPMQRQSFAPEFPAEEPVQEGQLTVDVYHTSGEIIIQTMTAGVRPDDLAISITPEKVIISGKREAPRGVAHEDYFFKELYWGAFSRTILLSHEVVAEEAEAMEKHGLLIIRLPKIDKEKMHRLKVKSL